MGSALIRGIIESKQLQATNILVHDHSKEKTDLVLEYQGIRICDTSLELYQKSDIVILAIKPCGILPVLSTLVASSQNQPLIVSIAAGITLGQMQNIAQCQRIIRVMPNTPALIGKGVFAYAGGQFATNEDCQKIEGIFSSFGFVTNVQEKDIDAISAISGSGPAYMFVILDALCEAGVAMGLNRNLARELAIKTMEGSALLAETGDKHLMQLRDEVTSPGGTTIAALNTMDHFGLRNAIIEGTKAAFQRAREISTENNL